MGYREVAETGEVFLELRHAGYVAALLGVEEAGEVVPRGGVGSVVGGYYSYWVRYDSGGKNWAGTKEGGEEED